MSGRAKAKAVGRDGKVSLCILDERWPFAYLQVYCNAEVETDPDLVVDVMMAVGPDVRPATAGPRSSQCASDGRAGRTDRPAVSTGRDLRAAATTSAP